MKASFCFHLLLRLLLAKKEPKGKAKWGPQSCVLAERNLTKQANLWPLQCSNACLRRHKVDLKNLPIAQEEHEHEQETHTDTQQKDKKQEETMKRARTSKQESGSNGLPSCGLSGAKGDPNVRRAIALNGC